MKYTKKQRKSVRSKNIHRIHHAWWGNVSTIKSKDEPNGEAKHDMKVFKKLKNLKNKSMGA